MFTIIKHVDTISAVVISIKHAYNVCIAKVLQVLVSQKVEQGEKKRETAISKSGQPKHLVKPIKMETM